MSSSPSLPLSEIARYIEASGESENIDVKGPMSWDNHVESANLAKDIVSFANSRDGGVIVIGKSEVSPGTFEMTGLTEEQAISFETTKVATWVNSRFSPPVRLCCHPQDYDGKKFVVITVSEFDEVPILCTKSFQEPNSKNHCLKERTIYVRNVNAESAPLGTVDELRRLVGLATSKRGSEMISMFESMLKGRPLVPAPSDEEQFTQELEQIEKGLEDVLKKWMNSGGWSLIVYPGTYRPDRWNDKEELEAVIHRRSVGIRKEFPPHTMGPHPREWGICNDTYGDIWTLSRSGLFAYWKPYLENETKYACFWRGPGGEPSEPDIDPGCWLDFKPNVYNLIEMFMFIVRFVEEFEPGENIHFRLRAESLAGRKLVSTDPQVKVSFGIPEPCKAQAFETTKQLSVEEFRANWKDICARTMKEFFGYFPGPSIQTETMLKWVERFEKRQF